LDDIAALGSARLRIVGQAPGRKVHETGIPWDDPSGDRLRNAPRRIIR
jgi:uracil-DNA glycosylase